MDGNHQLWLQNQINLAGRESCVIIDHYRQQINDAFIETRSEWTPRDGNITLQHDNEHKEKSVQDKIKVLG